MLKLADKEQKKRKTLEDYLTCSRSARSMAAGLGLFWRFISSLDDVWLGDITPLLIPLTSPMEVTVT